MRLLHRFCDGAVRRVSWTGLESGALVRDDYFYALRGEDLFADLAALLAADPALGLEAADDMAQAGERAAGDRRQLAHAERAIGGFRQAGQDDVVELGDARVPLELGVQRRREPDRERDNAAPGCLLFIAEPLHDSYSIL